MSNFVLPQNSQLLFYPMKQCTISAGFKAKKYKEHYGYNHYGVDFDSLGDTDFDVLAGATGEVLGVEMNNGSDCKICPHDYPLCEEGRPCGCLHSYRKGKRQS